MHKYTLRTVSDTGELIKENKLELKEGSILIMQVDTQKIKFDRAISLHKIVEEALKNGKGVLTIPDFVKLKVLEMAEGEII